MACFTLVQTIEDSAINREARKKLGLPLEGGLTTTQIRQVRVEAGVIKAKRQILKLQPTATIIRKGNELEVTVMV